MSDIDKDIRVKDLKTKFVDIYNYIEEYKLAKKEMENKILNLENQVQLLLDRIDLLENT